MIIAEAIMLLSVATAGPAERGPEPRLPASGPVRAAQAAPVAAADDSVAITVFSNISGAAPDDWIGAGIVDTLAADLEAISEFPKWRKYLISLSFRGQSSVRPVQVGGFDVNIVIHRSTAVRGRGGPARHDAWPPSLGAILAHTDGPCGS